MEFLEAPMSELNRAIYEFGPFRLDAQRRLLLRDSEPVKLFPKEFDTLLALVERGGEVLDKDELMRKVWGETIVEESNLSSNISHLRKLLGESRYRHEYIVTIPGRGYQFVAGVKQAFDEVIVRERTRTEIIVEQEGEAGEIESIAESEVLPAQSKGAQPSLGGTAQMVPAPALVTQEETTPGRKRLRIALLAGLFGLLLAGAGGGVWLYQSRNREREHRAAGLKLPQQQMTLRRFATHGGVPYGVAISPDGKSLVYKQSINDKDSLWLGQIETNNSVPISHRTDLTYGEPAFAPDGGSIYFTVSDYNRPQALLVRMPVLGGVMTELIPNVHGPVTFSPDGKQLAFLRGDDETNQNSIIIADSADGKREHTLITRKLPLTFSSTGLAWSPDGQTIAVGANKTGGQDEILAVSVADSSVSKIGTRDWGQLGKLAWLPDGGGLVMIARENAAARKSHIWFVPYPDGEARRVPNDLNIYLMNSLSLSADGKLAVLQGHIQSSIWIAPNADLKQARRVLEGVAPRYEGVDGLAWTPDGRLLYTAYVGDSLAIWSMNSDGGNLRQLTSGGANSVDNQMSVTADGRYMVFQSNRSGGSEIWRANTNGSGLKQLTAAGGNSLPSLSPDGQWVVYTSVRDDKPTLWRISIDGGEAKQLTYISSSWSQVSPDGKYIAYTAPSEAPGVRLMIIPFEGGEPVKSFAVPETGLTGRRAMRWMPDGKAIIYKDHLRGLWQQGLDKEKPQPVKGFEDLRVRHLAWSFDGKSFAYTSGPTTQEIILIENFK